MENPSTTEFAGGPRAVGPLDALAQLPEDCRLARAAGVNLLVVVPSDEGKVDNLMGELLADATPPVVKWQAGERLTLPVAAQTGTFVLHNVGALTLSDQRRLIEWLERTAGRTQVISTTPTPVLPLVQEGTFLARLYYRLNTVCVDVNVTA